MQDDKLDTVARCGELISGMVTLRNATEELKGVVGHSVGGRELALVITKLQEAEMWAVKAGEEMASPPVPPANDTPSTPDTAPQS